MFALWDNVFWFSGLKLNLKDIFNAFNFFLITTNTAVYNKEC